MNGKDKRADNLTELRQRAEAIFRGKAVPSPENPAALSPEATQQMVYELQVNQLELEMQNEELRRSQVELDASWARYFELYDLAPVGYFTTTKTGLILHTNFTAANLLGVARGALVKQRFSRFISNDDQHIYYRHRKQLISTDQPQSCELRMVKNDGTPFWAHLTATAAQETDGATVLRIVLNDITEHKQAEDALREQKEFFHLIAENIGDFIAVLDLEGRRLYNSPSYLQFFGAKGDLSGTNSFAEIHPEDQERVKQVFRETVQTGVGRQIEYRFQMANGNIREMESYGSVIRDSAGRVARVVVVSHDITERKQAEQQLRIAAAAFESQEGIVVTDAASVILRVNPAFSTITGYTAEEAVGQTMNFLKSDRHDVDFYAALWETIRHEGTWHGEIWNRIKNGEVRPHWITISAVKNSADVVTHYVGAYTDNTERNRMEEQVRQLAFHDPLTKLPNRRLLNDRLSQTMAASARSGCYSAMMFLDLDNFKLLNDTHGHVVGDLLLIEAADRLKSCIREMDTVARFGGDEFVVMVSELDADKTESTAQAQIVAEKIRFTLSEPYLLAIQHEGETETIVEHDCSVSIGVVLFINREASQDEILKWADTAMYQAKEDGRNLIRFYEPPA